MAAIGGQLVGPDILGQLVDPGPVMVVVGGEVEHAVVVDIGFGRRALVEHQGDALAELDRRGAMEHAEELAERGVVHLVVDTHDLVARQVAAGFQDRAAGLGIVTIDFKMTADERVADGERNELRHRNTVAMPFDRAVLRVHERDGRADDRQRIGLELGAHHVGQLFQTQLVVQKLLDFRNIAIGTGYKGEVEMFVHGMAGLQLQGGFLDGGKQSRVVAMTILGDAEARHFPSGLMTNDGLAAHCTAQFGNCMGVHSTFSKVGATLG